VFGAQFDVIEMVVSAENEVDAVNALC